MTSLRFRLLWAVVLVTFTGERATAVEQPLLGLTQDEPAFYVQADVDRADRYYRDGDPLRVTVVCEAEAYIYVLYQQADGKVFQIFPNSVQADNKVPAREVVQIPAKDDRFRWAVSAPFGKEAIKVIASKQPVDVLADQGLRQSRFNSVTSTQVKDMVASLQEEKPKNWTESIVEITTVARDGAQPPRQGRRFGVFFGSSEYEFNEQAKAATQGKWQPNLPCPANNALVMARLMKSMGRLDDFRLCVNDQATKANFQQALTDWLPSVSRPGDTVFVMYCGHGGQIPDDNEDERDRKDEYLLMHDYVDVGILEQLLLLAKDNKLPEQLKPRVAKWLEIVRSSGSPQKANEALTRFTCISDDLLGHWLQRLAGRQILLMLDTCHAGGFVANEKGFTQAAPEFDFLDSEIGRLKDLGQSDSALIAACSAQQSSYGLRARDALLEKWRSEAKGLGEERVIENLAVFSYYLVDGLVALPPPMDARQMQDHCRAGMKDYFEKINEIQRKKNQEPLIEHAPVFYNYSRQPIWFKP